MTDNADTEAMEISMDRVLPGDYYSEDERFYLRLPADVEADLGQPKVLIVTIQVPHNDGDG